MDVTDRFYDNINEGLPGPKPKPIDEYKSMRNKLVGRMGDILGARFYDSGLGSRNRKELIEEAIRSAESRYRINRRDIPDELLKELEFEIIDDFEKRIYKEVDKFSRKYSKII